MECVPALIALGNVRDSQGLSAPSRNKTQTSAWVHLYKVHGPKTKNQNSLWYGKTLNDTIDLLD